jgi:hypothetical protein
MTFHELLLDELRASHDAAEANDLLGETELGEWWRWRAKDLERYLLDASPVPSAPAVARYT